MNSTSEPHDNQPTSTLPRPHVLHIDAEPRLAMRNVDNRRRADMTETWLDAVTVLLRHNWDRAWDTYQDVDHWWLVVDGAPVAYLHTLRHLSSDTHQYVLCDIEVREEHRGHGYARLIVEGATSIVGDTLYTSGGFTPLGAAALSWVPILPGQTPGVHYEDMPFVRDWDNLIPINPL